MKCLAAAVLAASVTGCAAVATGTNQTLAVQTEPSDGARCELRNDKGQWLIFETPGITSVAKAYSDLLVTCETKTGWKGATSVRSITGGAVFGNAIIGGVVGAVADVASGAAYEYPSLVKVVLLAPDGAQVTDQAP